MHVTCIKPNLEQPVARTWQLKSPNSRLAPSPPSSPLRCRRNQPCKQYSLGIQKVTRLIPEANDRATGGTGSFDTEANKKKKRPATGWELFRAGQEQDLPRADRTYGKAVLSLLPVLIPVLVQISWWKWVRCASKGSTRAALTLMGLIHTPPYEYYTVKQVYNYHWILYLTCFLLLYIYLFRTVFVETSSDYQNEIVEKNCMNLICDIPLDPSSTYKKRWQSLSCEEAKKEIENWEI